MSTQAAPAHHCFHVAGVRCVAGKTAQRALPANPRNVRKQCLCTFLVYRPEQMGASGPGQTSASGCHARKHCLCTFLVSGTLLASRFLTRGYLQTIQGSSGKPSKDAVVCRRFRRARNCARGPRTLA
jgi:hypothetical protein